jgi:rhodanese-related sulfurtransferase
MTVQELKKLQDAKAPHYLLDVREQGEWETCSIKGATLIPMSTLQDRLAEIPKDKLVVVHCHHGGRSARVVSFLQQKGYDAHNLEGGIDAWSEEIDPAVPRY